MSGLKRDIELKKIRISKRSRKRLWWMRLIVPLLMNLSGMLPRRTQIRLQRLMARGIRTQESGLAVDYDIVGGVPGFTLNGLEKTDNGRVILYLHGGAFLMPIIPQGHVTTVAKLASRLGATAFLPDYRLAPLHVYPAALDDCERAYRGLLELGFDSSRIVIAGESAGGNLVLGLLQRIRRLELPAPACAIPISPVAEMGRVHAPPSKVDNAGKDAMIPAKSFVNMLDAYCPGADASDPELSPILADFTGLPPLFFLVGDSEILLDDSLICARQARRAGVEVRLDVWPLVPHAFPLLEQLIPEVSVSHEDICDFCREHLPEG